MDYERYYRYQTGGGRHFFKGAPVQRGYGLGNILGGLLRSALPVIKQGAKTFGKQALKTGAEIASDALKGQNIKASAKKRLRQAGHEMTSRALQRVSNPKRRQEPLKRKATGVSRRKAASKRRKRSPDIFDY